MSKGTTVRKIRVDDDLWRKLDEAARATGPDTDRSTVLRQLARWFVREPGAELPERPTPADG